LVPSSSSCPLVRFICLPDIDRPIGGVKQLYRHVEHLSALGWDAAVVTQNSEFRPSWFVSSATTISLEECFLYDQLQPHNCILVLPETYVNCDLTAFYGHDISSLPRVIFNQNAYYTFGQLGSTTAASISNFYKHPNVLQVLNVSVDTHSFLRTNLGIPDSSLSRIINSIEPIFVPDTNKQNIFTWMPRKNPDHVNAVLNSLQLSSFCYPQPWKALPLSNLTHSEVANNLNSSRIFLSFGHPEGFGLPIAEAMCSGCWVVGYSGGGGRELFNHGGSNQISFGDWSAFTSAVQNVFIQFADNPRETTMILQRQSLAIRTLYSHQQERDSISSAWLRIKDEFNTRFLGQ
tara:strand:- start:85 stop:1125 length:1041 start_codon:yes stop_codon:yes gene_type:complete